MRRARGGVVLFCAFRFACVVSSGERPAAAIPIRHPPPLIFLMSGVFTLHTYATILMCSDTAASPPPNQSQNFGSLSAADGLAAAGLAAGAFAIAARLSASSMAGSHTSLWRLRRRKGESYPAVMK